MKITFDPNGGDMGRAVAKHMHPLEFNVVLPHVADILEMLHTEGISALPFKYAFEFDGFYKKEFEIAIATARLPPHVTFYECDGRNTFEMRGASGGLVHGYICYLVTKR